MPRIWLPKIESYKRKQLEKFRWLVVVVIWGQTPKQLLLWAWDGALQELVNKSNSSASIQREVFDCLSLYFIDSELQAIQFYLIVRLSQIKTDFQIKGYFAISVYPSQKYVKIHTPDTVAYEFNKSFLVLKSVHLPSLYIIRIREN